MRDLAALRDDGPLAAAIARAWTGAGEAKARWLQPPLVRGLEYGGLIAITAAADPNAMPWCFALLGALAFHHYDLVYRRAAGRGLPPRWLALAGGGWELRLAAAGVLAVLGALEPGLVAGAAALAALYLGEAAASWSRPRPADTSAGAGGETPE